MTVSEAAAKNDLESLRKLLEADGDPNEQETEEYWPPLLEASYADHVEAARLLLDAGADMYAPHSGGETPLLMAAQQGSARVFRLLVERGCLLDAAGENAPWMLTQAAAQGRLEIVKWMLDQGVAVDVTEHSGCSALTYAAHGGHIETMEELLRAGADPNHRDNDTESVLMWAADHPGNAAALRVLISAGADVNAMSDSGTTPLYWAVWSGKESDPEMLQVLLDAGADPNTPRVLSHAVYYGFTAGVAMLIERGADTSIPDANGETPLETAMSRGHRDIVKLLNKA